jgi:adenylosuccinate lyase
MCNPLEAISPIDGRYRKTAEPIAPFMSESALMKYRIIVEGEYLIALSKTKGTGLRALKAKEEVLLRDLYELSQSDAQIISDIEFRGWKHIKATDHDVKAIEYYMKDKLSGSSLKDVLEWLHFALTSYDTNTLARGLMLSDALGKVILPKIEEVIAVINGFAKKYAKVPMLSRTHGQSASPTTVGKEFRVFGSRLEKQVKHLKSLRVSVKFSGATGNYNAHTAAFPKIDWLSFSKKFVGSFNKGRTVALELNVIATQIDPHDREAEIFDNLKRINTILIGFNQDMWRYISDEWITQRPAEGTIGSSTMPHKINPLKFENSEGNLGMANALFEHFGRKLPISRLQRDLSDSTVERNFGAALAYALIAYEYLLKGMARIAINENKIKADLNSHPEIVSEGIQTILRAEGIAMPYEKLKELTRGKKVTIEDISAFIDGLEVGEELKKRLKKITPESYVGLAAKLAGK